MDGDATVGRAVASGLMCGAGLVLCCVGVLKFHGLLFPEGAMKEYLHVSNPIFFFLPNIWVLALAAVLETYVGLLAMRRGYPAPTRAALVLWLSLATVAYRAGLALVRYHGPCGCLFGINRFLPLSLHTQDLLATILLPTLIVASASVIVSAWVSGKCRGDREPGAAPGGQR
jgi:hypothetical protein